jgi:hypothetical protein
MTPDDLRRSAELATTALHPARYGDWSVPAGGLEWDCRTTIEHLLDTLILYTAHLATRTDRALPYLRRGDAGAPVRHLIRNVTSAAWILAGVAEATPPGTLAFHPAGNSDAEGFCAMGCDELLVHVHDIASGLGLPFRPPEDLAGGVLLRLFPALSVGDDAWSTLLWANGRLARHGEAAPADWVWQSSPAGG